MAEFVLIRDIGRLNSAQLQIRKEKNGSRYRQSQRKLSHPLRRSELGEDDEHSPLAAGVNHVARKRPREIRAQRQPSGRGSRRRNSREIRRHQ